MKRRAWTPAEIERLRRLYPNEPTAVVAKKLRRGVSAIYGRAQLLGLHKTPEYLASPHACRLRRGGGVGAHCRFPKGNVPWNKGTHWTAGGRSAETRFRKGNLSGRAAQLIQPIGAYRINGDGYLDRKVTTAGRGSQRWKSVHRIVWEAAHGPVPPGYAVCFKPGRFSTVLELITPDALELVSRRDLMKRNTVHNLPKPLAQLVQLRGALNRQINARERHGQEQDR